MENERHQGRCWLRQNEKPGWIASSLVVANRWNNRWIIKFGSVRVYGWRGEVLHGAVGALMYSVLMDEGDGWPPRRLASILASPSGTRCVLNGDDRDFCFYSICKKDQPQPPELVEKCSAGSSHLVHRCNHREKANIVT